MSEKIEVLESLFDDAIFLRDWSTAKLIRLEIETLKTTTK